jgi:ribosomal protein S6--L-glutamate ligase
VDNPGFDIKLYVMGTQVYAVRKESPLHPDVHVTEGLIPVTPELRTLALNVGEFFGLDLYGVDVIQTAEGWVGVDINDFPSFGGVPGAVDLIASFILHVAGRAAMQRPCPRHASAAWPRARWCCPYRAGRCAARACRPTSRLDAAY